MLFPDVKGVELGYHGKECSFEAILKKHNLRTNPALVLLGKIVNVADTDNALYAQGQVWKRLLKDFVTWATKTTTH